MAVKHDDYKRFSMDLNAKKDSELIEILSFYKERKKLSRFLRAAVAFYMTYASVREGNPGVDPKSYWNESGKSLSVISDITSSFDLSTARDALGVDECAKKLDEIMETVENLQQHEKYHESKEQSRDERSINVLDETLARLDAITEQLDQVSHQIENIVIPDPSEFEKVLKKRNESDDSLYDDSYDQTDEEESGADALDFLDFL